jgi:serine/threonine protein kinase
VLISFSDDVKLADFGLARTVPQPGSEHRAMSSETGSYRFMAPEIFSHQVWLPTPKFTKLIFTLL